MSEAPAPASVSPAPIQLPPALVAKKEHLLSNGFAETTPNVGSPNFLASLDAQTTFFYNDEEQRLIAFTYFGRDVQGPPNIVHGGAVFTIVDMSLAICVARAVKCLAFTANVSINYRAPARLENWVVVDVKVDRVEKQKKIFVTFDAHAVDDADEEKDSEKSSDADNAKPPTKLVEGTSLFIANLAVPSSL